MADSIFININDLVSGMWGQIRNTQAAIGDLDSEDCPDRWSASGAVFSHSDVLYGLYKRPFVDLSSGKFFFPVWWWNMDIENTSMAIWYGFRQWNIFHFEGVNFLLNKRMPPFFVLWCCLTIKKIIHGRILNDLFIIFECVTPIMTFFNLAYSGTGTVCVLFWYKLQLF